VCRREERGDGLEKERDVRGQEQGAVSRSNGCLNNACIRKADGATAHDGRCLTTFVICNMLMAVFSQSYFPVSYGCRIFPRSSSFNFFFQYCLSVFHSIACS